MTVKEYLFNGGDESLPAVKFVYWLGNGCAFCGFYRVFFVMLLALAYSFFGFVGLGVMAAALVVFMGAIVRIAQKAQIEEYKEGQKVKGETP
jgi:hypothetical protein